MESGWKCSKGKLEYIVEEGLCRGVRDKGVGDEFSWGGGVEVLEDELWGRGSSGDGLCAEGLSMDVKDIPLGGFHFWFLFILLKIAFFAN